MCFIDKHKDVFSRCLINFGKASLSDAVVFKVEENIEGFLDGKKLSKRLHSNENTGGKEFPTLKCCGYMPYWLMSIEFLDALVFINELDKSDLTQSSIVSSNLSDSNVKVYVALIVDKKDTHATKNLIRKNENDDIFNDRMLPKKPLSVLTTFTLDGDNILDVGLIQEKELDYPASCETVRNGVDLCRLNAVVIMGLAVRFIELLSCKNITYEQERPPAKLQKSRAKKGKPPLSSYYVLKLKPTTTKRDYEAKNLWTNRIHLCRGHVREYTEERPLFGKYAGRFWIPPHARGDRKQGVIHKDYQLETTET